jgi:hypothetical protein
LPSNVPRIPFSLLERNNDAVISKKLSTIKNALKPSGILSDIDNIEREYLLNGGRDSAMWEMKF